MTTRDRKREGHPRPSRAQLQSARLGAFRMEALRTSLLEDSPLSVDVGKAYAEIPQVALPSLGGLRVDVPPSPVLSQEQIDEQLRRRRALKGRREARGRGALVQRGDDVVVTFVGFERGAPKPGAAALRLSLSALYDPMPGMREALVGCPVGESRTVHLDVPYAVRVESAHPITPVRLVEDDEEERRVAERRAAREQASLWLLELQSRVIDAVRQRTTFQVPERAIDATVQSRWSESEGRALVVMGIPQHEQKACLEAWQRSPEQRADAKRRIEVSLLTGAYARERKITVCERDVLARLSPFIKELRGQPREVLQAMAEDRARSRQLLDQVLLLKCMERLTREVVGDDVVDAIMLAG